MDDKKLKETLNIILSKLDSICDDVQGTHGIIKDIHEGDREIIDQLKESEKIIVAKNQAKAEAEAKKESRDNNIILFPNEKVR